MRPPDPARGQGREECLGEVEPRGRGGDGTGLARVDRLVGNSVRRRGTLGALDVGRERCRAIALECCEKGVAARGEAQRHLALAPLGRDLGREVGGEFDAVAHPELARRTRESVPAVGAGLAVQRELDLGPPPPAQKARGDDLGVVEHEEIARTKQLGKLAHRAVRQSGACHIEEPGGIARVHRLLRDALGRQDKVERLERQRLAGTRLAAAALAHRTPSVQKRPDHTRTRRVGRALPVDAGAVGTCYLRLVVERAHLR